MVDADQIDTELYLRDGFPHATVCKVQLKDGRIGIGLFRQDPKAQGALGKEAADKAALDDALENVPDLDPESTLQDRYEEHIGASDPDDLQASLGQPARQ